VEALREAHGATQTRHRYVGVERAEGVHAALCDALDREIGSRGNHVRALAMQRDGFEALAALLPPKPETRCLALVDPSYEDPRDLARTHKRLVEACRKFSVGTFLVWVPIKDQPNPTVATAGANASAGTGGDTRRHARKQDHLLRMQLAQGAGSTLDQLAGGASPPPSLVAQARPPADFAVRALAHAATQALGPSARSCHLIDFWVSEGIAATSSADATTRTAVTQNTVIGSPAGLGQAKHPSATPRLRRCALIAINLPHTTVRALEPGLEILSDILAAPGSRGGFSVTRFEK
jgi:hypothetical protein